MMAAGLGNGGGQTTARTVIALLASTLGWEVSEERVTHAMRVLGLTGPTLAHRQGLAILDELAKEPGMVGVTARFARSRADLSGSFEPASSRRPSIPDDGPPSSVSPVAKRPSTLALRELVPLLSHAVGQEKAHDAILAGVRRLSLPEDRLGRDQAALLFEDLAQQGGLVGVTARFAKARLILLFGR
jgi:hypothetical protein